MERRRGSETRRLVTVIIFFCAMAIPLFAVAGCGEQMARLEENQTKLQAMVAANARELATISSQLHTGQGKINESIQTLDGDTRQVAAGVASVQNGQRQLHDTVAAGNEGLNRRIGYVEDNQRSLQGSVTQVSDVTQRTAADLTSLAQEHTALQQMVRTNQQELTGSIGAVVSNQQRLQTGIGDLRQANEGLAGDIASISAKHDTLYATLQDNDKRLAERLATLTSGHGQLCADIANVHTLLQTMATELTAANTALKEQLGTSQETLTAQIAGLSTSQQHLQAGVDTLSGKADQTVAQLADTKSSLQDTLRVSREVLTGQIAASLQNQQALQSDVRDLNDKTDKLTANVGEVATGQTALRETLRTNQDAVITTMAGLSDNHQALRGSIDKIDGKTDRVAGDIGSMATQQQSLYEAVKANQDVVVAKLAEVTATTGQTARDVTTLNNGQASLQQAVRATEQSLGEKAGQTAASLNTLTEQQAALQQSIQTGHVVLTARATELAGTQQALKSGIETLGQATQRVAADIATMTAGQNALHQTLKVHSDKVNQQVASLANSQEEMKANLDTLTATTGQASLDILALGNNQTGLAQTVRTGMADLGTQTDKVAAGLTTVAAGQSSLNDTLNRNGQAASGQIARIADGQQQMQSSLDTLTATTGQTALDVIAMTARQNAIQAALQSHDEASGAQMAKLMDNQQQIQSSLDTVTATTGQASLDTLAMNNSQGQLGQAVFAGRQEMTAKLTALAQDQQNWSNRLDAAQAKVASVADSIAALEQQITRLQAALQTGIQGATAILGTTTQQRQQFETKVSQDIQAVMDSLTQLRQTQTLLQEQITQVQRSTQGQAESIRSAIEQMKTPPSAASRMREAAPAQDNALESPKTEPAPAEIKISSAVETPQAPAVSESAE